MTAILARLLTWLDPDRLLCRWANDTHEGTDDDDQ